MFYGDKDYRYGLPGPNPPRNKAGGFKCALPGGYQREWGDLIGVGTYRMVTQGHRKPGVKGVSVTLMQDRDAEITRKLAAKQPRR